MAYIFSNPFVHTVYYFREVFSSADPWKIEGIKDCLLHEYGHENTQYQDFAFNENVNCSHIANGVFMRLNACSLMKLHHWCLYPTGDTVEKIAQYVGFVFLSPVAALADVVTNVTLLVFKLSAWPILRIATWNDDRATECLNQNISWQYKAVSESLLRIILTLFQSVVGSVIGLRWASLANWGYSIHRYEGADIPFMTEQERIRFARILRERASMLEIRLDRLLGSEQEPIGATSIPTEEEKRKECKEMLRHYESWFQNGREERILDPQRVRYLREHCGWILSKEQLKDQRFYFRGFRDAEVALRFSPERGNCALIIKGFHSYKTANAIRHTKFIQRTSLSVPGLTNTNAAAM